MTTRSTFKHDVREFAELNDLNYTGALREFDVNAGIPLSTIRDESRVGPDYHADDRWAAARGLVPATRGVCFHSLGNESGRVAPGHTAKSVQEGCGTLGDFKFKDHPRDYLFRGPNDARRRPAVISFSPYQNWDSRDLRDELDAHAKRFDVRYRVGMARDVTYGSGTIPIVFWNPRVIDLP